MARLLHDDRREALERLAALTDDFDDIVAASANSNADDEHDSEGATIAFERSQVSALIAQARARLRELDLAQTRLVQGSYGICVECGAQIAPGRLEARPSTRTCLACASSAS